MERSHRIWPTYGLNSVPNLAPFLGSERGLGLGSEAALLALTQTPNSVPFFGTEFGAAFRPAYYFFIKEAAIPGAVFRH